MRIDCSAAAVVEDYTRRNIAPDKIETVNQGLLAMWLFCNEYVCEHGWEVGLCVVGAI